MAKKKKPARKNISTDYNNPVPNPVYGDVPVSSLENSFKVLNRKKKPTDMRGLGLGGLSPDMQDQLTQNNMEVTNYSPEFNNGLYGTSIPFIYGITGKILSNPSSVSVTTFKKMADTDDVIKSCLRYNSDRIINSIGDYVHPNEEIQTLVRQFIKGFKRGWTTFLRDCLMGTFMGASHSEMQWGYDSILGATCFNTYPLPQSTIVHKADLAGDLDWDGVGQFVYNSYVPNVNSMMACGFTPIIGGGNVDLSMTDPYAGIGDADYPVRTNFINPLGLVWIPTSKLISYVHYGVSNGKNPYGESMLRSIHYDWAVKYEMVDLMVRTSRSKSSNLMGFWTRLQAPQGEQDPNNPQRNVKVGSISQNIQEQVVNLDASGYMCFEGMPGELMDVTSYSNNAQTDMMLDYLKWLDSRIQSGLMVPQTAFAGGGDTSGGYSISQTHDTVHERWVESMRNDLINNVLIPQFVVPFIDENYIEGEHKFEWGTFGIGQPTLEDQMKMMEVYERAINAGIIDRNNLEQLQKMQEYLDFPKSKKVFEVDNGVNTQTEKSDVRDIVKESYTHGED